MDFCLPVALLTLLTELAAHLVMRLPLVGVVVWHVAVLLVVELLGLLLGLVLGFLTIDEVGTLGLGETVDAGAGKASNHLLGERVVDLLSCEEGLLAVVFWKTDFM